MPLPTRAQIVCRLEKTLDALVTSGTDAVADPPAAVKLHLDAILVGREHTVRDGMLTLLAMGVEHGQVIDWRTLPVKGSPARSASRHLGHEIYPRLHIAGSSEALQTGVKGTGTYRDRSTTRGDWEAVLDWASAQTQPAAIEQAFSYLAAGVAATARDLPDMPSLDTPKLTFAAVFALLDDMLAQSSAGAHEQFVFAALLEAWRAQLGEPGVVETKHLNASDASAGTAADVQERHRGQVTEAYELTAADYTTKVKQAGDTLRQHDLRRTHIVARGAAEASGEDIAATLPVGLDLTVLDVREECRSLLARLGKPHRRHALERLYVLLVSKQSNDALVQSYVSAIGARGLGEMG